MRCVDAMCLLIGCLWKGLDSGVTPELFHHADVVPAGVERVQNPIVDRPGASAHRVGLILFSEGGSIIQALMQPAARLELTMDFVHQLVAAHVGKAAPLEDPGRGVGKRLEELGAVPEHRKECLDLFEDNS